MTNKEVLKGLEYIDKENLDVRYNNSFHKRFTDKLYKQVSLNVDYIEQFADDALEEDRADLRMDIEECRELIQTIEDTVDELHQKLEDTRKKVFKSFRKGYEENPDEFSLDE